MTDEERICALCYPDRRRKLYKVQIWFEETTTWERYYLCSKCFKDYHERNPRKHFVADIVKWNVID